MPDFEGRKVRPSVEDQDAKRRVKAKLREDRCEATGPNETWGHGLRPRPTGDRPEDPDPDHRGYLHSVLPGDRSAVHLSVGERRRALDQACARLGYPKAIRIDQGTEFVSRNLDLWAYAHGVTLDFSRPGKPTDNAFIEAFNGRFRAECLNAHWFLTLADAAESWRLGAETTTRFGPMGP